MSIIDVIRGGQFGFLDEDASDPESTFTPLSGFVEWWDESVACFERADWPIVVEALEDALDSARFARDAALLYEQHPAGVYCCEAYS